jgi:hypothetical protein
MITVNYPWGNVGIGNHFFIYSYLRQLSEKLELKFITPSVFFSERSGDHEQKQYKFKDTVGTDLSNHRTASIDDSFSMLHKNVEQAANFLKDPKCNIVSNGYYQKYTYWKKDKDIVKEYFRDFIGTKKYNCEAVAIHLRKSLQDVRFELPNRYYLDCLDHLNCSELFIFADDFKRHRDFIEILKTNKKHTVNIVSLDVLNTLKEITSFDNIICSQGSFSFWAAFLSTATNIFQPLPNVGPNNPEQNSTIDYNILDDNRYHLIRVNN